MECSVCCETYNRSNRKKITCNYCSYEVCVSCAQQYLLQTTQDAHCMNCHKEWNIEFIQTVLQRKFITHDWKQHRENVLLEREKSLLPATQPAAEMAKKLKELTEEERELRKKKSEIKLEESKIRQGLYRYIPDTDVSIAESKKYRDLVVEYHTICADLEHLALQKHYVSRKNDQLPPERKQFIRACPSDGCRGFLSTQWKCGLCHVWVCPTCHEIKGDNKDAEHKCKSENVETAKLLARDSKPCPKCAAMIFKIDGCDQMYCTQCNTAFSWKTGRIEVGIIHNPHYYEFMRRTQGYVPRNPEDNPCGAGGGLRMPNINTIHQKCRNLSAGHAITNALSHEHMQCVHIINVVMPTYRNENVDNQDLRIKYLLNEIDDAKLKLLVQQREKANHKKRDIYGAIEVYATLTHEMFTRIRECETVKAIEDLWNQNEVGKNYIKEQLQIISKRYNCVTPHIE